MLSPIEANGKVGAGPLLAVEQVLVDGSSDTLQLAHRPDSRWLIVITADLGIDPGHA